MNPASISAKPRALSVSPSKRAGNFALSPRLQRNLKRVRRGGDYRRKRALFIYNGERPILHVGGSIWRVPSQSSSDYYAVSLEPNNEYCECRDYRATRHACKHIVAAKMRRANVERGSDFVPPRADRHPNAKGYDALKARELRAVQEMLRCLGAAMPHRRGAGPGRPTMPIGDVLICGALAAYHNRPTRKAIEDPELLVARGIVRNAPPCATTLRLAFASSEYHRIVRDALAITANCVAGFESLVAIDGVWVKTPNLAIPKRDAAGTVLECDRPSVMNIVHAIGCESLVVLGAVVRPEGSEQPAFLPLLRQIVDLKFPFDALAADAGFNKAFHYEAVHALGALAYIDFDKDAKPMEGYPHHNEMLELWKSHYHTLFNEIYKYRKLIETANSVFKRTIKRILRARTMLALENEALTLLLVHNLMRLHAVRHEYGIALPFCDERALAVIDGIESSKVPRLIAVSLEGPRQPLFGGCV